MVVAVMVGFLLKVLTVMAETVDQDCYVAVCFAFGSKFEVFEHFDVELDFVWEQLFLVSYALFFEVVVI